MQALSFFRLHNTSYEQRADSVYAWVLSSNSSAYMKIEICIEGLVISGHMLTCLHAYIIYINQPQELLRCDSLFVATKIRMSMCFLHSVHYGRTVFFLLSAVAFAHFYSSFRAPLSPPNYPPGFVNTVVMDVGSILFAKTKLLSKFLESKHKSGWCNGDSTLTEWKNSIVFSSNKPDIAGYPTFKWNLFLLGIPQCCYYCLKQMWSFRSEKTCLLCSTRVVSTQGHVQGRPLSVFPLSISCHYL